MRLFYFLILLVATPALWAQENVETQKGAFTIKVENNVIPSFKVLQFNGFSFTELANVPVVDGMARVEVELNTTKFFYVGTDARNMKPIILAPGVEENMMLNQKSFKALRFDRNGLNGQYATATKNLRDINKKRQTMVQKWHAVKSDPAKVGSINQIFSRIAADEKELRDSFAMQNPFFGNCYDLMTYPMFQVDPGDFQNELAHYVNRRFEGIDWTDPNTYNNTWTYEAFREFADLVSSYTITEQDHLNAIKSQLFRVNSAQAKFLAYGGILAGLEKKRHPNYSEFASGFLAEFKEVDPGIRKSLETKMKSMEAYRIGGVAPVFTQNDPDGNPISLEDFKGKVVLLDFWASWCGPCRRENPNVVKVYEKYKDQGFEILGVSLDKDRKRWVDAIAKDNLTWPQVSDLKGWSNEAGRMYGVSSIPHTVLVDGEGKIIALKLRGEALEKKLEEIFLKK